MVQKCKANCINSLNHLPRCIYIIYSGSVEKFLLTLHLEASPHPPRHVIGCVQVPGLLFWCCNCGSIRSAFRQIH